MELDTHKLLVGNGPACDTSNLNEYIQKNMKLYELHLHHQVMILLKSNDNGMDEYCLLSTSIS